MTLGLVVGAAAWAFQARAQTRSPPLQMPRSTMAAPASPHAPAAGPLRRSRLRRLPARLFLTALSEATKRVAANSKDAAAMTLIGEIYRDGLGGPRRTSRRRALVSARERSRRPAGRLRTRSAAASGRARRARRIRRRQGAVRARGGQGSSGALYNLGVMAIEGMDGKAPDYAKAAQYFLRAANAGDDDAAYSYGVMLRDGKGVPHDIAESGALAQARLRRRHYRWPGRIRDHAVQWRGRDAGRGRAAKILLAAARGNPIAQNRVAHLYVAGRGAAARPGQGRALEQFRQGGRPRRCRTRQGDRRISPGANRSESGR